MIKLICGSMFSGKSTNLMRYMEKFVYAKKKILFIRPEMDNRGYITHNQNDKWIENYTLGNKKDYTLESIMDVMFLRKFDNETIHDILSRREVYDVIFIDEYFMIKNNRKLLEKILKDKYDTDVYLAGLIADSNAKLFKEAIQILPLCDDIEKVNGVCIQCGSMLGNYSYYKGNKKKTKQIKVGDDDYSCICGRCFFKNPIEEYVDKKF